MTLVAIVIGAVFVLQIPVILEVVRGCCPRSRARILHRIARNAGDVILFLLVWFIGVVSILYFYLVLLPYTCHPASPWESTRGRILGVLVSYMWINGVYNFVQAVRVPAGVAPPGDADDTIEPPLAWCDSCSVRQTPGSVHCRRCGVCVAHLCHHCPFTLGCVGAGNLVYFYSFLTWALAGTLVASILTIQPFFACWWNAPRGVMLPVECHVVNDAAVLFGPVAMLSLFMVLFWSFHTMLLIKNTTTVGVLARLASSSVSNAFQPVCAACGPTRPVCVCGRSRLSRWRTLVRNRRRRWWHWLLPIPAVLHDAQN